MLLAITKKELERIEHLMLPAVNSKICIKKKIISIMASLGVVSLAMFIFLVYNNVLPLISSFVLSLFNYIVMAFFAFLAVFPMKIYPVEIPTKNIKKAIVNRLKSFYLPDNNVELLKTLYEKSLLKKDQKKKIERFLTINDKTIVDYLNSLGDKNLAMLAAPYRDQIDKDINEAVESYFIDKSKELELQIIAENNKKSDEEKFKEDCLNFFYSTMPKNIATQGDKLCY